MRQVEQPPLQPGGVDEQGGRLGADHLAVTEEIDFNIVLASGDAGRDRNPGAEQGLTEEVDAAWIFRIKPGALMPADGGLALRMVIMERPLSDQPLRMPITFGEIWRKTVE